MCNWEASRFSRAKQRQRTLMSNTHEMSLSPRRSTQSGRQFPLTGRHDPSPSFHPLSQMN